MANSPKNTAKRFDWLRGADGRLPVATLGALGALALTGLLVGSYAVGSLSLPTAQAQSSRPIPYWASLAQVPARMRKGPSGDMPVIWEYHRRDLPLQVVAIYQNWRKVRDPDGVEGWMNARLLKAQTTAIVIGGRRPMHASPDATSAISYHAEAGVVGRTSDCTADWCYFDVNGRSGWIATSHIWGARTAD